MEYGFANLEPKSLEQIEGNDFEEFCEELLRFERDARHPGAHVSGTAPPMTGDSGKDLRLTTKAAPTTAKQFFSDALTEDHVGETYFSCKGGSDWAAAVLADVGAQGAPLDVLSSGGHFTIFIHRKADLKKRTQAFANAAAARKAKATKKSAKTKSASKTAAKKATATFEEALLAILDRRLKTERSTTVTDLAGRVHVYDGSHLAAFLKRHRPSISSRFASRLGIRRLEYLLSLDQWERELAAERGFPTYVADASRTSSIDTLRLVVTSVAAAPGDRAVWVHGPPGVGKSRMVLEALQKHPRLVDFKRRVVVARTDAEGGNAISAGVTEHSEDVILVVDECPAERAANLAASFLGRSSPPSAAVIVMIGPRPRPDQTTSPSVRAIPVDPLDDDAGRALVLSTLGIDPTSERPLVERVLHLCEGYPWSAILIAQALRDDRNALPEGATHWDACELVLAGKPWPSLPDWHKEALRRAKAILAVMLTDAIDWADIDQNSMDRVAMAVGLASSPDLQSAAEDCDNRGLLRRRLEWKYKYVTPNNVARQVAIHLLGAPHHAARSIRAHCRELMPRLHQQLGGLDLPPGILETLADDELESLDEDPPDVASISRGEPSGATLTFIATHRPAETASLLRRLVDRASTADWQANGARLVVGSVLSDLSRRRAGFNDAEEALYRLTVQEARLGATLAINSWRSLFLVRLNPTYLPYAVRLARLTSRLAEGDEIAKKVVIRALEVATSEHELRSGGDPIDGPWLQPTTSEANDSATAAWKTLFSILDDPNSGVASAARRAIESHLRSAVRTGVGATVLGLMVAAVSSWPAGERVKAREAVDLIRQYDTPWLEGDAAAKASHDLLLEALKPQLFHERLVDAVGRWRSWQGKTSFEKSEAFLANRDEELAREGLREDVQLKGELDWLESDEAHRLGPFMTAVGRVDGQRRLLPALEARCRAGRTPDLIAAYLAGAASAGREEEVDALLRRWRSVPELALPTFLTVWRIGPSDERISWLVADIEAGRLKTSSFQRLTLGSWGAKANNASLRTLANALLGTKELPARIAALSGVLARVEAVPDSAGELLDVLAEAVLSLAAVPDPDTMVAYEWELACKKLLEGGRGADVISSAMVALGSSESVGFADRVWTALHPLLASHGAEIWAALTKLLETSTSLTRILIDAQGSNLMSHVPPADVIRWIGNDRGRQIAVAEMCDAHEAPLNPLARALIQTYGADSPAGSVLAARVHSTPSAVSSLAQFARDQLTKAHAWANDTEKEVARWGAKMVQELQQTAEEFDAHEEYEKRRRQ